MIANMDFDQTTQKELKKAMIFHDVFNLEKMYSKEPEDLHPIIGAYCPTQEDLLVAKSMAPSSFKINYRGPEKRGQENQPTDSVLNFIEDLKRHKIKTKKMAELPFIIDIDLNKNFEDIYYKVFRKSDEPSKGEKDTKQLESKVDSFIQSIKEEEIFSPKKNRSLQELYTIADEAIDNLCQASKSMKRILLYLHKK